jgi:alkylation response protein AidB-like acyl-CoA dehydrogenase
MHFELSPEQEELRATTARFLEDTMPVTRLRELWESDADIGEWWARGADLGWASLFGPEALDAGSLSGGAVADAVILAEELGQGAAPGPFHAVNAFVAAVTTHGAADRQAEWLPGVLGGTTIGTWAFAEAHDAWSPSTLATRVVVEGDDVVVTGSKHYVESVAGAELLLVTGVGDGGLTQVVVPAAAAGVTVRAGRSVDLSRRFGTVDLDAVRVPRDHLLGAPGGAADDVERLLQVVLVLQSAEMHGAAGRVFDATVEYAKDRYAFGRPIGSFQALKHRFADMLQRLEFSRAIADGAARALDAGDDDAGRLARVAKCYVADAALDIVDDCVQINGGIGITWEHDAHVFSRRIALDRALWGSPELHKEELAGMLGVEVVR